MLVTPTQGFSTWTRTLRIAPTCFSPAARRTTAEDPTPDVPLDPRASWRRWWAGDRRDQAVQEVDKHQTARKWRGTTGAPQPGPRKVCKRCWNRCWLTPCIENPWASTKYPQREGPSILISTLPLLTLTQSTLTTTTSPIGKTTTLLLLCLVICLF